MCGKRFSFVTDNGTQCVSREYEQFCAKFNIGHVTSAVFHPASNGEAERLVQTFKNGLTKKIGDRRELVAALLIVMASYRTSPHSGLNWSTPAEVLHGRQPKNLLSLFSPGVKRAVPTSATDQKLRYGIGSLVYAQNYASGNKWYPGRVTELIKSAIFMIRTNRKMWKRHLIQLQPRFGVFESTGTNLNNDSQPRNTSIAVQNPNEPENPLDAAPISRRYLTRSRRPPDCYQVGF